jgi:anti-sigma regulatory factor (Ser/Thr protein kinase)
LEVTSLTGQPTGDFRHDALLYEGPEDFVARTVPFIRSGLAAGDPVMVAVTSGRTRGLREALAADAERVRFVDMERLGRNPARIIPAWEDWVREERRPDRLLRGIGEPIWAGRSASELEECQLHESLLNVAFAASPGFHLVCPYDASALDPTVIHEARCSHPVTLERGEQRASPQFRAAADGRGAGDAPLPKPPAPAEILSFDRRTFHEVRGVVARRGGDAGLDSSRTQDLVLAVHELAANSVRHGGGNGVLRAWLDEDAVVCEVRDRGQITDPLAGRRTPDLEQLGGRGLWLANQTCDLVQLRSSAEGTVIRVHMRAA